MPERRGRRHKRDRRDRSSSAAAAPEAPAVAPVQRTVKQPAPTQPARALPSRTARISGVVLALVTGALGIAMFVDAFSGGNSSAEVIGRTIAGCLLVGLAVFVTALVVFPAQIRDYLYRRQERRNARAG